MDYYQYNTNVNVEIRFTDQLPFPAVTVCNQNYFRLTKSVETGLYEAVTSGFQTGDFTELEKLTANMSTKKLMTKLSHNFTDMIESCWWKNKPCSADRFKIRYTLNGVCYTFNHDFYDKLTTSESGSKNGLRLTLNTEEYEHMDGPNYDAGLKILLHNQGEDPLISDKGFAVASGVHAFVDVHLSKTKSLPPLYGNCTEGAVPLCNCLLECKVKKITEKCGCVPLVSRYPQQPRVCGMGTMFTCGRNVLEKQAFSIARCGCDVPCERTFYDTKLSFTQLSKFNIEKLTVTSDQRRAQVKSNMLKALETKYRNVKEILLKSVTILGDFITTAGDAENVIENMEFIVQTDNITSYFGLENSLNMNKLEKYIVADSKTIQDYETKNYNTVLVKLASYIYNNVDSVRNFVQLLYQLFSLPEALDGGDIRNTVIDTLANCFLSNMTCKCDSHCHTFSPTKRVHSLNEIKNILANESRLDVQEINLQTNKEFLTYYSLKDCQILFNSACNCSEMIRYELCKTLWLLIRSGRLCEAEYFPSKKITCFAPNVLRRFAQLESNTREMLVNMENIVESIYDFSPKNVSSVSNTLNECMDAISLFQRTAQHIPKLFSLVRLLFDETATNDSHNALSLTLEVHEIMFGENISLHRINQMKDDITKYCNWPARMAVVSNSKELQKYEMFQRNRDSAVLKTKNLDIYLGNVASATAKFKKIYYTFIKPKIDQISQYQNGNLTTMELASALSSEVWGNKIRNLVDSMEDSHTSTANAMHEIDGIMYTLKDMFYNLMDLDLPLLHDHVLYDLQIWRHIIEPSSNDLVQKLVESYTKDRKAVFKAIIKALYHPIKVYMQKTMVKINKVQHDVIEGQAQVEEFLKEFLSDVKMDHSFYRDNFVTVDIFYSEMSYTDVVEQKAFVWMSLVSEVGGFMGLFLGASILSICELVDYLLLSCCQKKSKYETDESDRKEREQPTFTNGAFS